MEPDTFIELLLRVKQPQFVHSHLVLLVSSLIFKDALLKLLRHLLLISPLLTSSLVLDYLWQVYPSTDCLDI